jgi:Tetratricopeptide repeat
MNRSSSAWQRLQQRWITGERLDEREQREHLELARAEPEANRELQFYEQARHFLDETTSEEARDDARFLERLLKRASPARGPSLRLVGEARSSGPSALRADIHRERRFRPRLAWLVAGVAAAAALTLVAPSVWRAQPLPNGTKAPGIRATSLAGCELTSFSGVVTAASKDHPVVGQRLVEGATVATGAGSACLSIDGSVRVCLPSDSQLVISSLKPEDIRVGVTRGRGIASLSKRTAGAVFSMTGNGVIATAHGTVFTLELLAEIRSANVTVLEGSVEVSQGQAHALVQAGSRARVDVGGPIALLPASDSEQRERLSWLSAAVLATPARARAAVDLPMVEPGLPRHEDAAAGVSRDALFAAARAQARLGNPQAARALYRELVARYPGPGTAAVQVVLGNLEMELGAPERALTAFEAYLRSGGPLEPEALHGKVRALRTLGRKSDERATIRSYLERYPQGFQAPTLRQRLTDLE